MRKSTFKTVLGSVATCLTLTAGSFVLTASPLRAADIIIGVGSGSVVQNHAGRAICRAIKKSVQGLSCEIKKFVGRDAAEPLAVLSNVRNGAIEIGLVPSDWLHYAFTGTGPAKFLDADFKGLRVLLALYDEPFTVIARRDAGISSLDDLKGKRVNIGNPGSSQRAVMDHVLKAKGWSRSTFQVAEELSENEQSLALCHNRIQAMILVTSHPNSNIKQVVELCGVEIVSVSGSDIEKIVSQNPYYSEVVVKKGTYDGQGEDILSFGVRITVVGSEDLSDELASVISQAIVENVDGIKNALPALRHHSINDMMRFETVTPMHSGAERYFKSKGMM